ncbi:MFS transporter [Pseudolysobacter antarcticus]|uniref:MFS transporter n=1 Tax=Pseudolysobacter antarcticus TaxID=2511995 RepID=A0A411HH70_9GAMM|nr:MFS transporter [Pseudolysobacter antarcticus]QBB69868.1 MFS transporter [Pseudolysobacter antarcticus]
MTQLKPVRAFGSYRWLVVVLLFLAMIINYVDRQTLGILKSTISADLHWSNSDYANVHLLFQGAYAVCYLLWGRLVDRIGARWGFALAFGIWSVAQFATSAARGIGHFMVARFALGIGESGAFPGSIKAVSEWFPQKERALANGLFNAGTNIGAIVTPLIIPAVVLSYGWQMAFVVTGLAGLIWLPIWLLLYRHPQDVKGISQAELDWIQQDPVTPITRIGWRKLLRLRQTWTYATAKFMTDPIFGMYLVWLPDFLGKRFHLDLKNFGPPLIVIYLLSDFGSVLGGWLSSHLLKRGWSVNRARKTTLLICALCATPVMFAAYAENVWVAVAIIGLAAAAHQGFSANLYALPSDLLPRGGVGSVVGIGGMLGACGGMLMSKYTGWTLDADRGYAPIFLIASCAYLCALLVIHLFSPRMEPAELIDDSTAIS